MANPIYSIYCVDGQASTNGSFGSSSWYGKENGTNLLPPTSISFGQLEPATTYWSRVKTVGSPQFPRKQGYRYDQGHKRGSRTTLPWLHSAPKPNTPLRRMKFFTKDSTILRCSPISSIRPQAPRRTGPIKRSFPNKPIPPNPWEGAWVVYPFANSRLLATWGMASTANYIDGQAKYKGQANRIAGDKSGSLKGWYIGSRYRLIKVMSKSVPESSNDGYYIATPALDSPLLSAEGTLCTFSFGGCPLMTDGRVVDIEVYRAATKTFEKVTSMHDGFHFGRWIGQVATTSATTSGQLIRSISRCIREITWPVIFYEQRAGLLSTAAS